MKKLYVVLTLLIMSCVANQAIADDLGMGDATPTVENAWYGQKQITDEDFEKTITKLKEKKKGAQKKFKGQSLNKEQANENYLNELSDKTLLLTLPVELMTPEGQEIPTGHYRVVCRKEKNKIYMDFRQSHSLIATVEALETDNDFGETAINFVKLRPYSETKIKVIYGSIDFNAATLIDIKDGLSD